MYSKFYLPVALELLAIGYAIWCCFSYRRTRWLAPRVALFLGTFSSGALLFFLALPEQDGWVRFFLAIHNAIRLFVVDFDLQAEMQLAQQACETSGMFGKAAAGNAFIARGIGLIFIVAPILTFDLVLSFFGDIHAHVRRWLGFTFDRYVFSELNEKSSALAESVYAADRTKRWDKRRQIIFAGVKSEEVNDALADRAKAIHALCFRRDMASIGLRMSMGGLTFFAIGENGEDNVRVSTLIRKTYGNRRKTKLYIFSPSIEAEMFASSKIDEHEAIEIRCVNEARSLVYRTLYDMERRRIDYDEPDLFARAQAVGPVKRISAVIVGLGLYGEEMLKALTWFCQMDGYQVKIDAFDMDKSAKGRFEARYPEVMGEALSCADCGDQSQYDVTIHSDIEVESIEFIKRIKELGDATYVFVALGSDEANIAAAVYLRMLFEQNKKHPVIEAVIYNSDKARILDEGKNFKGAAYDIHGVGNLEKLYSENVIINSALEKEALSIHLKYGKPDNFEKKSEEARKEILENLKKSFYAYEYNYRSSSASALHLNARIACGLQGKGKEDERKLSVLEHRRWAAYMRTEGYRYGGSIEKHSRNDLAKMHNLLVPFDEMPKEEQEKDRRVALEDAVREEEVCRKQGWFAAWCRIIVKGKQ